MEEKNLTVETAQYQPAVTMTVDQSLLAHEPFSIHIVTMFLQN